MYSLVAKIEAGGTIQPANKGMVTDLWIGFSIPVMLAAAKEENFSIFILCSFISHHHHHLLQEIQGSLCGFLSLPFYP